MKFKRTVILAAICALAWVCEARGEEELAPGYNECAQNAETSGMSYKCDEAALKYWAPRLEAAYKAARQRCKAAAKPTVCADKLKKFELAWLDYTNARIEDILGDKDEFGGHAWGQMAEAKAFEARATKAQCQALSIEVY